MAVSQVPLVSTNPAQFTAPQKAAVQTSTFNFIVGWILLILILTLANQSRLGHVIIYYSLLLMIIFILVAEYQQFLPTLGAIGTIGQLQQNQLPPMPPSTDPRRGHST